ncbi:hypothetical protein AVEN_200968-1 [Araneus ventricosus]|uniref:Uncharacterized protein n=1 Tax=Araneus ventricosus TaxID=182803 RepID=A0A4Y2VIK3_ARAVE|nr:hypothetical protein AVEN_200968-1 [Araneus ventricosus]
MPGVVKTAPINIKAGFRKTGIYPLNVIIFTEQDFMPAYATDRTNPEPESAVENEVGPTIIPGNDRPEAGFQKIQCQLFRFLSPADTGASMISAENVGPLIPEDVRPLERLNEERK